MKITVVQLNGSGDVSENMREITRIVDAAIETDRPDLVVLPEVSSCRTGDEALLRATAEPMGGPYHEFLSGLAARHRINLHSGSSVVQTGDKLTNTSVLFDRAGDAIATYSKMHMFDVTMPNGATTKESAIFEGGREIVTALVDDVRIGLTICYDLRFGRLFDQLAEQGAELIVVPSAFHLLSGMDQWETLLRARAIETQCYVVGPNHVGAFDGGAATSFAHSMIVDPWGVITAQVSHKAGYATARFDRDWLENVRMRMPLRQQQILGR
jgi:nitrilase